ncbi:MAG TPA: hypothetical protein VH500_11095 [Nitrososphaeraceae archaeon]
MSDCDCSSGSCGNNGDITALPPKPADARKRTYLTLRKEFTFEPEFKKLWDKIKNKTRYFVKIDTNRLVDESVKSIDNIDVGKPRIIITKARVAIDENA